MIEILKYTDEQDKSLGIAGMAISLVACDGEDYLAAVSIEPEDESLSLGEDFFFTANPRMSAKIAWKELLSQYNITAGLILGNVMCRNFCAGRAPSAEMVTVIHDFLADEGSNHCELEEDEIESMFNKNYTYYSRLFSHPRVMDTARSFAETLRRVRRMTGGEVLDSLKALNF